MRALSSRNTKPNAAGSPRPPRAASGARYDVLNRVGEGTLFVVYRVREKSSDRLLALKALKSNFNAHPQFAPALAQALADSAALSHPALARIEEVGREDGTLFQLQEWLPGQSLEARLRRAPFGRIETLSSTRQIAEALQFLHENGAIHGDLRPRQIISASDGQLKLTDYGLSQSFRAAGLSPADVLLDAVGYAAPELSVAAGRDAAPATPASDLYALGVILYRMLAGRAPFDGPSPIAVAMRHRNDAPLPPSRFNPNCAPDLEEIALRLLEKNPVARYASAAQLLQALNAATAQSTVFTAPQNHSENQSESVAKTVANQEDNKNSAPVESSTRLTNAPDESDAGSLSANSLLNAVDLFPATMLISDIASAPLSALNSATSAATAPVSTAPVATSPVSPTRTDDLLTEAERERKAIKKHRRREALGAFLAFFCIWIALGLLGGLVYGSYNWWVKQTPPDVVVPSYIGKNEDEARAALEKAGLKFNQVGEVYDLKRPAGTVIRGFPPAGKIVKPGRLIDVTVSRGAEKVVMPDLIEPGLDLIQARRILQAAGMRLGNIATTYNDTIARGYICGQFPQSGDSFSRSEPINLVISRGPQFAPAADKQNAKNSAQDGAQNADTQNSAQDGKHCR